MRPVPLVHLPSRLMAVIPLITNSVIRAAHGEPPLRLRRLDRAIVHAERLLDELRLARLALEKSRKDDAA